MKRALFCVLGVLMMGGLVYAGGVHWGYSGNEGPEHWGELDPSYAMCGQGKNQSPINLTGFIEGELTPLAMNYGTDAVAILNNGHTVQADYTPGSTLKAGGREFELKQFHFHAPSENTLEGKSFPLEAHLVHADAEGNLAVVAVMFEEGAANELLEALWAKMPKKNGDRHELGTGLNVTGLLPADRSYYRFNGSLTTPPCSEGVWWLVMKNAVEVSEDQVEAFEHVMHHPNNRPVQPRNARMVLK